MSHSIRKLKEDWNYESEIYVQYALKNIDMLHENYEGFITVVEKKDKMWSSL